MASKYSMNDRPSWPRRAIVTAGEPYGNKGLHFGHVGGVFVPADFFARFLRDRLGRENVIFTSGTDCYGSPIMESYRKLKENEGYDKSIGEYVESNHSRQAATLNNYNISCDIYGGSGLEPAAQIHNEVTAEIIERLHEQGTISKRSTLQFYDAKAGTFLNGRQVIGRCPIQGCKSEKAYADECDLGHQFGRNGGLVVLLGLSRSLRLSLCGLLNRNLLHWFRAKHGGHKAAHVDAQHKG